jgi:hypothetical protein
MHCQLEKSCTLYTAAYCLTKFLYKGRELQCANVSPLAPFADTMLLGPLHPVGLDARGVLLEVRGSGCRHPLQVGPGPQLDRPAGEGGTNGYDI